MSASPEAFANPSSVAYDSINDRLLIVGTKLSSVYSLYHVADSSFDLGHEIGFSIDGTVASKARGRSQWGKMTVKSSDRNDNLTTVKTLPQPEPAVSQPRSRRPQFKHQQQRQFPMPINKPVLHFPALTPLLMGYLTFEGNPFSADGVDQGWRKYPIFSPPSNDASAWKQTMSAPGDIYDWLLPNNINGVGFDTSDCIYFEKAVRLSDSKAYRDVIDNYFPTISQTYNWTNIYNAEYSMTPTAQFMTQASSIYNAEVILAIGRCKRYTLSIGSIPAFSFTPQFINDLRSLPQTSGYPNDILSLSFIQRYGMIVPSSIDLGASVVRVSAMDRTSLRGLETIDFDLFAGAEANLLFLLGLDPSSSTGSINLQVDQVFRQSLVDNYTSCLPVCPPSDSSCDESGAAWQSAIINNNITVQPIGGQFITLPDMLTQYQNWLPPDLQGAALTARLQGLTTYVRQRLCVDLLTSHGGASGGTCSDTMAVAYPHWQSGQPSNLRNAVAFASGFTLPGGGLMVVGGHTGANPNTAVSTNQIYVQGWATRYALNTARSFANGAQTPDGNIWVCGGSNSCTANVCNSLASCEISNGGQGQWQPAPALSVARAAFAMNYFNGNLIAFGGQVQGVVNDSIEVLTLSASPNVWKIISTPLPAAMCAMASVVVPVLNAVVLVGGFHSNVTYSNSIWIFDNTSTFSVSPLVLPTARAYCSAVLLDPTAAQILVFGGMEINVGTGLPTVATTTLIIDLLAGNIVYGPTSPWELQGAAVITTPGDSPTFFIGGGYRDGTMTSPVGNITFVGFNKDA